MCTGAQQVASIAWKPELGVLNNLQGSGSSDFLVRDGMLGRCCWRQTLAVPWLQADDKKFKEELGRMIDLEVWDAAKAAASERLRGATQTSAGLGTEISVRQEMLRKLQDQARSSQSDA